MTGLIGREDGKEAAFTVKGSDSGPTTNVVLRLTEAEQVFVLEGVDKEVVLSTNRHFSAPIKLTVLGQTTADLLLLMRCDTD